MKSYKPELLEISEQIVDLSDRIDELEFEEHEQDKSIPFNKLCEIGDRLLEILPETTGDESAYTHFALGSVCALLGHFEKAEASYDKALSHWPDHVGILNEAFDILVELGKYDKAREFIERSIKHGGETPDILFNYASLVSHMGNLNQAKIILINALAKFPNDKGCRALLEEIEITALQNTES